MGESADKETRLQATKPQSSTSLPVEDGETPLTLSILLDDELAGKEIDRSSKKGKGPSQHGSWQH